MALGKRAWRWRNGAWRGAVVKVAGGNTSLTSAQIEQKCRYFKHTGRNTFDLLTRTTLADRKK